MLDLIKSYLVGLGFQVNQAEFQQALKAISDLERTVQRSTFGMTRNYATTAAGVTVALGSINAATAGLVAQVAKADMQYQKFALRLWTTKETAKSLKTTLDAMGEDMEDVAWIPELRREFMQLRRQGRQMQTPADADGHLRDVRSLLFEFRRMKLEVQYASEWIAYYLTKYLGGPLANLKKQLSELNDQITLSMPEWTKKVAEILTMFMNVGMSAIRFVRDLYRGVDRFFDLFPPGARKVVAAILLIGAAFKLSPIGATISALLLLIEDFYGYIDGRKSSKTLAPVWKAMLDFFKTLQESMRDKSIRENFVSFLESFSRALESIGKGIERINRELFGNVSSKSVWRNISDGITGVMKDMINLGKVITGVVELIGLLLQGDMEGARRKGSSILRDFANVFINPPDPGGNGRGTSRSWGNGDKQMMQLAQEVSRKTGIPAHLIYGQWHHESGGFSSQLAKENNNFAGLTQHAPNDSPQPDGSLYYKKFGSPQEFADYYAKLIPRFGGERLKGARTADEFARILKTEGYYGDSIQNYAAGIKRGSSGFMPMTFMGAVNTMRNYRSASAGSSAGYTGAANITKVDVGDIYIMKPNATPAQITQAIASGVQKAQGRATSIQVRELNTVVI